ncbi:MAG: hypothetical protein WA744_14005, partial [Candidatus Acidiferrales bacterium]
SQRSRIALPAGRATARSRTRLAKRFSPLDVSARIPRSNHDLGISRLNFQYEFGAKRSRNARNFASLPISTRARYSILIESGKERTGTCVVAESFADVGETSDISRCVGKFTAGS